MTYENVLKYANNEIESATELYNSFDNDISKELVGYSIEGWTLIKDAVKKQIPKKPAIMEDISTVEQGYDCPGCHSIIFRHDGDYCPWCGQKIDWGDK